VRKNNLNFKSLEIVKVNAMEIENLFPQYFYCSTKTPIAK